ncbi:GGDEF domain-containing protein [Paenibacillus spongiae]|uniref:GGDEF domain-containing protein n=1 Tax=Paenibacillus spongiae TaxID=2909671 RepID=A0ABY5SFK5_9BACL|nr:GGDEF domain-containing protein [Paenibacillus spongiae]UVI31048.1 GGDEF domain-containing protein [Paenibacillus spongiae]
MIYNEHDLQAALKANRSWLIVQLLIVFGVTIVLSAIISRWVARPMTLAFHDSLTGLKNRAAFDEALAAVLGENRGTTALIDLDNFKAVNDNQGHAKGDHLLQCTAQSIRTIARKEDITIRWGGDEFVLIMPATSKQEAEESAKSIIAAIKKMSEREFAPAGGQISVSIGISLAPEHGVDPEMLCKRADIALYASKEKGKDQYRFYSGE